MPNLVGLWLPEAAEGRVAATLDRQLSAVQASFHTYRPYRMGGSNWAAAHLDHGLHENGAQPGVSGEGRWHVLIDGEILNLPDLAIRYRIAQPGSEPVHTCADLLATAGLDVIPQLSGTFALVIWDAREQRLHLVSDRHATRPLFYREHQGTVAFATELKGIIAAQGPEATLDPVAVCEQLVYGVHFWGRSWLHGCTRMPPASVLTLSRDGMAQRCYWQYEFRAGPALDAQTYAARFAILLDRAVERCMRGSKRIGIFLSGGYDSRSVAASIRGHHLPIPAFTFGEARSRDMQIAPALAARLGLTHFPLPPAKPYLHPNAAAIVWRTEGLLPFSNATSVQFHDVMASRVDIFLTGFLGEFSGSHTWPALLMARNRRAVVQAIYERFVQPGEARARLVLRPEVFTRAFEELRERFFRSFEFIPNEHPMDIADAWNFTYLQPGGSFQAPAVDRHRLEMRAPHLDGDLVSFLLTIPPRSRIEQRIYKLMIATAFPAIRDIPCANSMRPIEPRFWLEYPKMVARFAGRKLADPVRRLFGREDRLGRELSDLDADVRDESALRTQLLEPLVQAGHLDGNIFSLSAITQVCRDHYEAGAQHGRLLMQLTSIGLAVRQLLHGDVAGVPLAYRSARDAQATEPGAPIGRSA
jgi:asparagine synthetase B (glutamine-hydrolysing)